MDVMHAPTHEPGPGRGTSESLPPATKFGAIDVGTNSIHLVLAEISPQGDFKVLGREKDMVQLGKGGFAEHVLTAQSMEAGLRTLGRFKRLAESQGVTKLRVVATSAVREASNGGEFVERVWDELGLRVHVIAAEQEARLIYIGVRHAVDLGDAPDAESLIIDIGGGSVEMIAGNAERAAVLTSVKLGASRLAELFIRSDPLARDDVRNLRRHIRHQLDPVLNRLKALPIRRGLITSGSAKNLALICAVMRGEPSPDESRLRIHREEARTLRDKLTRMSRAERLRVEGLDPKRVDACIPAVTVIARLMKLLNLDVLEHCDFALREGVMIDYIARKRGKLRARAAWPNPRPRSVMQLAERCDYRAEHAHHVADLAGSLFDGLQSVHKLDPSYRELLTYAGLLHDIGHLISHDGHHKHSYYLISNGSLKGFTPQEVEIIANIARYHRKERPKKSHFSFQNLDPEHQKPVRRLALLLRLADALDRTGFSLVRSVQCQPGPDGVTIRAEMASDAELELWCARRHAAAFRREFDLRLRIRLSRPY